MASNTGKVPLASSSKAPPPKQTPPANKPAAAKAPAKKPAAAKTKQAPLVNRVIVGHCRLQYQVDVPGQDPSTEYQAMESLSMIRDLRIDFCQGNITVTQKTGGNWCIRTFLKKDITWDGHDVPEKQDPYNRFLEVNVHLHAGTPLPLPEFKTPGTNDPQQSADGVEKAKGFPLANLPANVYRLRLLLSEAGHYWTVNQGAVVHMELEIRGRQIKRILTGVSSVKSASAAARKLDSDFQYRKEEAKVGKKLPSGLESSKIEPTYDSDKIDESHAGPFPTPAAAAAPMLEAGLAPGEPPACINPSISTRRDDIAEGATAKLKAWARQQGLARKDESPVAPTGLPTEQPRPKASEVEGKGSGKDCAEEEREELELQLVQLEQTRKERQRQLWDRFKIDEYNVETSKVDQEYYQQKTDLQQQFLERRRRRV